MSGRSIYKLPFLALVLLLLLGCMDEQPVAGEERPAQPVVQKSTKAKAESGPNPLSLAQDTIPISRQMAGKKSHGATRLVAPTKIFASGDELGADTLAAQVFRVQLGMIDTYSDARRALAVALEIFDQPVSLDYEVPYYKLRVGEFPTRKEAELYQQRARGAGYANAWVMVATVTAKQIEPVYPAVDSISPDSTR